MIVDRFVEFSQALWLLAFGFYAWDVARLVPRGTLLLREARGARLVPVLAPFPFELARKELYLAGLFVPWRAVLVTRWSGGAPDGAQSVERADQLLGAVLPLRLAAAFNFVLLFVVAPALTATIGLGGALLIVVAPIYLTNALAGAQVVFDHQRFGVTRASAAWLFADVMLCGPYGANWVKRIARLQPELAADPAQLEGRMTSVDRERLAGVIALRRNPAAAREE